MPHIPKTRANHRAPFHNYRPLAKGMRRSKLVAKLPLEAMGDVARLSARPGPAFRSVGRSSLAFLAVLSLFSSHSRQHRGGSASGASTIFSRQSLVAVTARGVSRGRLSQSRCLPGATSSAIPPIDFERRICSPSIRGGECFRTAPQYRLRGQRLRGHLLQGAVAGAPRNGSQGGQLAVGARSEQCPTSTDTARARRRGATTSREHARQTTSRDTRGPRPRAIGAAHGLGRSIDCSA